jgi:hypothetical protein
LTAEERFERIEHVAATLAEERRKDHEDYQELWRDTNRQIADVWKAIDENRAQMREMAAATWEQIRLTQQEIRDLAAELRTFKQVMDERMGRMASGIAESLARKDRA